MHGDLEGPTADLQKWLGKTTADGRRRNELSKTGVDTSYTSIRSGLLQEAWGSLGQSGAPSGSKQREDIYDRPSTVLP